MYERRFEVQAIAPLDQNHGYALFSALSREFPALHGQHEVQIAPIGGRRTRDSRLIVGRGSLLRVRGIEENDALQMQGQTVMIGGVPLQIGAMHSHLLQGAPQLSARLTIYKESVSSKAFLTALLKQVRTITGLTTCSVSLGRQRAARIKGRHMLGWSVTLSDLSDEASLAIQSRGLGWGTSMGCGVFHGFKATKR